VSSKHHGGNKNVATGRRIALLVLMALAFSFGTSAQTRLTVSAAASLKEALVEAEAAYKQSHRNVEISNNFGSS